MDLITIYAKKRKTITTAIKRVHMKCKACEGRGYVHLSDRDESLIERHIGFDSFGVWPRGRGMFSQILTVTCSKCNGDCYVPAVESNLTKEELVEVLIMYYAEKEAEKERQEKAKAKDKTWDRKTNRGDPRYK